MSDTNSINGISTGSAKPVAAPHAPAPVDTATAKPVSDPNPGISPRIVVDPSAGVITQYLNTDGSVASQVPSSAVVAYLKAGLTAEGLAKPHEEPGKTSI